MTTVLSDSQWKRLTGLFASLFVIDIGWIALTQQGVGVVRIVEAVRVDIALTDVIRNERVRFWSDS